MYPRAKVLITYCRKRKKFHLFQLVYQISWRMLRFRRAKQSPLTPTVLCLMNALFLRLKQGVVVSLLRLMILPLLQGVNKYIQDREY
ncbi:hypothetical protein RDI58_007181 [Solanum bulbocastanum]|uniref:Uncharacterized protein n=1 Tax=Solanum bulbocastanum TaxID=147425 RepID=A0AAN8TSC6_SOLBU